MSDIWRKNAEKLNIETKNIKYAFLSHGHCDHTGGLQFFSGEIFCTSNIDTPHFSCHADKPVKNLTMPKASCNILAASAVHHIDSVQEILPGIFSTGKIQRQSIEDCGGPFFITPEQNEKDFITDESALLFDNGVLIHGCCHSGIINTMEHCRKNLPQIKINTIVGGLHLLHADSARLEATAAYLNSSGIKKLYLMHCTGENAIDFLKKKFEKY